MKVYFAGPDVFMANALEFGSYCKRVASEFGMVGLFPMDNEVSLNDPEPGRTIYRKNREMLDISDVVVVNLNDFRGNDPDAGTVWELAYAVAKGKKVVGYLSKDETLVERHRKQGTAFERDGHYYDEHDRRIENFGNHVNLMVQHSVDELVFGEVKDALRYVYDTWMSEPSPVI